VGSESATRVARRCCVASTRNSRGSSRRWSTERRSSRSHSLPLERRSLDLLVVEVCMRRR
jgi:hypothetical protein